jgi:hypothetical protein
MRAPSAVDETYLCSCGEPIRQCRFWSEVAEQMGRRGIPDFEITDARLSIHDAQSPYVRRLLNPLPRGAVLEAVRSVGLAISPAWHAHLREIHLRNAALVNTLQEITAAKVVIDSSKIALHLRYLLKSTDLNIKIIRLVRDGRAVVTSMLGHGWDRGSREQTINEAALTWRRAYESTERVLAGLPASQWIHVVYEELCANPEKVLRQIYQFIGLDHDDIVLNFRARQLHILGNDMRLKSTSEIRVDERWRTKLSEEDLCIFDEVAGEMNLAYGYT